MRHEQTGVRAGGEARGSGWEERQGLSEALSKTGAQGDPRTGFTAATATVNVGAVA